MVRRAVVKERPATPSYGRLFVVMSGRCQTDPSGDPIRETPSCRGNRLGLLEIREGGGLPPTYNESRLTWKPGPVRGTWGAPGKETERDPVH